MANKFYNLPPSWNPGFAIPDYVMAEPPERGVFVTQWMPRGTIPSLVPEFYAKPGKKLLGRSDVGLGSLGGTVFEGNTLATSTFGGGSTLSGDSLGATEYTLEPLGTVTAAKKMIAAVKRLPPSKRGMAMKMAMDRVDPTLHKRAMKATARARARGAHPRVALEHGISTALAQGVRSRTSSPRRPLRARGGLRGMSALGALPSKTGPVVSQVNPITCSADGQYKFVNGGWQRLVVGDVCSTFDAGAGPGAHDSSVSVGGWPFVSGPVHALGPGGIESPIQLGMPAQRLTYVLTNPAQVPAYLRSYLPQFVFSDVEGGGQNVGNDWNRTSWKVGGYGVTNSDDPKWGQPDPVVQKSFQDWMSALGIGARPFYQPFVSWPLTTSNQGLAGAAMPIATFKGVDGDDWGIWIGFYQSKNYTDAPDRTGPFNLWIVVDSINANQAASQFRLFNAIKEVIDTIINAACKLIPTAASSMNPYVQAGSMVLKLTGECPPSCPPGMLYDASSKTCACPPGMTYNPSANACQSETSWLPWLIIGGAGVAALLIATR